MTQKVGIVNHPILSMVYSIVYRVKLIITLIYPWVYKKLNMFLICFTQRVNFLFPFNFIAKIGKYFPYLYFTWLHIVAQFILLEWKVIIFKEDN
jgi:hypothetical protein